MFNYIDFNADGFLSDDEIVDMDENVSWSQILGVYDLFS